MEWNWRALNLPSDSCTHLVHPITIALTDMHSRLFVCSCTVFGFSVHKRSKKGENYPHLRWTNILRREQLTCRIYRIYRRIYIWNDGRVRIQLKKKHWKEVCQPWLETRGRRFGALLGAAGDATGRCRRYAGLWGCSTAVAALGTRLPEPWQSVRVAGPAPAGRGGLLQGSVPLRLSSLSQRKSWPFSMFADERWRFCFPCTSTVCVYLTAELPCKVSRIQWAACSQDVEFSAFQLLYEKWINVVGIKRLRALYEGILELVAPYSFCLLILTLHSSKKNFPKDFFFPYRKWRKWRIVVSNVEAPNRLAVHHWRLHVKLMFQLHPIQPPLADDFGSS